MKRPSMKVMLRSTFLACSILVVFIFYMQAMPPAQWTQETVFEITSGMSTQNIARTAKQQHLVRSATLLQLLLSYTYDPTSIYAGSYFFDTPQSVFAVAKKIASKEISQNLTRLTIPEGITAKEIAKRAGDILPAFDSDVYFSIAKEKEGYLFPDTYFMPDNFTEDQLLTFQLETYQNKTEPLQEKIKQNPLSEYEILILASIIEKEANNETAMKIVSGILQKRLALGMPLQADAAMSYIVDTPLGQLPEGALATSLRTIQSPYNTYLNTGLPPTPIGNPGLMAITAVLEPIDSDYLYYLTAPDGTFYYARTYTQHTKNIAKYLR